MNNRLVFLVMLGVLPLAAQNSSLSGVVSDSNGAVVPGASLKVENEDTTAARATVSNDRGEYQVVQVPPGKYQVTVEKPGFRVQTSEVRSANQHALYSQHHA